ncbi:hypothetical protein KAX97_03120 [candidate division WOR-3 bacterium]|nr:hypothetical protein [candidate division WOR-3 bacterium]
MLFSERYGHKKTVMLKKDEMPNHLRTRIWNVFHNQIFKKAEQEIENLFIDTSLQFTRNLWDRFLKGDLWAFDKLSPLYKVMKIKESYDKLKWFEIYDFVEYCLEFIPKPTLKPKEVIVYDINKIFEDEKAYYRIINEKVRPITSEEEIKEIEKALNIHDKFAPVQEHLSKALDKWADRRNPDYANSIKESISAVDLLVQIILGKEGSLGKLVDGLNIHPALKKAFNNLYGWTSNDAGIRHPKSKEPLSCGESEARYMLITCSAFINYIIAKLDIANSHK